MFVKKLREVQQRLLKQSVTPEICRFNMSHYGIRLDAEIAEEIGALPDQKPVCGTMACIAGEAIFAAGMARIPTGGGFLLAKKAFKMAANSDKSTAFEVGRRILGLTEEQACRLFFLEDMSFRVDCFWPYEMEQAYKNAKTATQRALIGAQRIELFIQSKGKK